MRVSFDIEQDCDLKLQALVEGDARVSFTATDPDQGETYDRSLVVEGGFAGSPSQPIVQRIVRAFRFAVREYGFATVKDPWGGEHHPTHQDEDMTEGGQVIATCDWYRIERAPRKRRWGSVCLRGSFVWDEEVGFPPTRRFNPAGKSIAWLEGDSYTTEGAYSAFSPTQKEWTRKRIQDGLAAAETTLKFYRDMSQMFEERTGELV